MLPVTPRKGADGDLKFTNGATTGGTQYFKRFSDNAELNQTNVTINGGARFRDNTGQETNMVRCRFENLSGVSVGSLYTIIEDESWTVVMDSEL